ncbi:MAG TPA: DUF3108 domain-containing protein [Prevotella sp.]|nr:DUF3108 domain-containing protein [Candidatus Segatella violae]
MKSFKTFMIASLLLLVSTVASAQCTFRNTAFKSGEFLTYNLYYNWKFVWVKAGNASMSVIQSTRNGKPAYRGSLVTRGNRKVDDFFVLRDTLLCYSGTDLAPMYFRKGAREGKRYTVDEVFYSYSGGKCHLRQHRLQSDGKHVWKKATYDDCVFDMMNIFLRARSFDPTNWKKGYVVKFPIADGKNRTPAQIRFQGKVTIKADNGVKYRCLRLAYMEYEDGKYKKIVDFYVTDDDNHVPVRLDMFLKFGAAKAFLVGMKGVRNPVSSIVK